MVGQSQYPSQLDSSSHVLKVLRKLTVTNVCLQAGWEARGVRLRGGRDGCGQKNGGTRLPERQDKGQARNCRLRPALSTEVPPLYILSFSYKPVGPAPTYRHSTFLLMVRHETSLFIFFCFNLFNLNSCCCICDLPFKVSFALTFFYPTPNGFC